MAKREPVTDGDRAAKLYYESRAELWYVDWDDLHDFTQERFEMKYGDEIAIVERAISLGRSLERAGGKPGKGKGGGK